jgi:transcriptional regulator with XRE-family HTH domain
MPRTLRSPGHEALRVFLVEKRKAAGLTQADVAARIGRHQSLVADIERGQRRVDLVELLALAKAIGFDPHEAVERMVG